MEYWINSAQVLGVAVVLGVLQLAWAAIAARRQQGLHWARGPRDEDRPVTGVAARLERAFRNYMETFPLFAAALILGATIDSGDQLKHVLTLWGSIIYVGARIIYVPLYAWGVPNWRTIVWSISVIGLLMVTGALFVPAPEAAAN
jgi:uncharacterized MAPEG superfamily protein